MDDYEVNMISKETTDKILALYKKIGIVKFVVFALVIALGYQALIILRDVTTETEYTPEGHTIIILLLTNLVVMCLMYFAYMYDHIFDVIDEVFV